MSTSLAITSLALSSAALASTSPTCGNSGPIPVELMYALKVCVALLLVAPVIGAIVDNQWNRIESALFAFCMMLFTEFVLWLVFFAGVFLLSPVGA